MRLMMKGDIDVEFDLSKPKPDSMDAWDISSELLHSGFLNWVVDEECRFNGVYLASKRNQATRLLRIDLSDYLRLLGSFVKDQVTNFQSSIDSKGRLKIQIS